MIEELRNNQIKRSCISARYQNVALRPQKCDIESFKALDKCKDNVVDFVHTGDNLIIRSDHPGNGKTSWACKIGLNYIDTYASDRNIKIPVLFVNVPDYIATKKDGFTCKEKSLYSIAWDDAIRSADLVIWDDIVTREMSEYDLNLLYVLINSRYSDMKANIFTSNCDINTMEKLLGQRLASRITKISHIVTIYGDDTRGVLKKEYF